MRNKNFRFPAGARSCNEVVIVGKSVVLSHSAERPSDGQFQVELRLGDIRSVRIELSERILAISPRWKGVVLLSVLGVSWFFCGLVPLIAASVVDVANGWVRGGLILFGVSWWYVAVVKLMVWLNAQTGYNGRLFIHTDRSEYVLWFHYRHYERFLEYARRLTSSWRMQSNENKDELK